MFSLPGLWQAIILFLLYYLLEYLRELCGIPIPPLVLKVARFIFQTYDDPKPLPIGTHRLRMMCTCGRLIPAADQKHNWLAMPACPECGGRQRRWWRRPVTLWERLRAWWELRQWKKRRQTLYGRQ